MKHRIRRRSGRRSEFLTVELEKPPEEFALSEQFSIHVNGRDIPVHVEIPIDGTNDILSVA